MVHRALEAAAILEKDGINAEVVDPRTLVPLDEQTILQSVAKTGRAVIIHEAVKRGGYGGEIASHIIEHAFHHLKAPIKRLGALPVPIPYNKILESAAIPQVEDIIQAVRKIINYDENVK